jgi:hypothetical protein
MVDRHIDAHWRPLSVRSISVMVAAEAAWRCRTDATRSGLAPHTDMRPSATDWSCSPPFELCFDDDDDDDDDLFFALDAFALELLELLDFPELGLPEAFLPSIAGPPVL